MSFRVLTRTLLPFFIWGAFYVQCFGQLFPVPQAGVEVDAAGVLRLKAIADPTGELTRMRLLQMRDALNPDIAKPSRLRKVSLNRLEVAIAKALQSGDSITDEMRYLAGLTRIEYVLAYPQSGDLVIAGPAEGYATDLSGRPIGVETGQAILELQDLIVALRAFPPGEPSETGIGCSIDPTPEGLQRMREFMVAAQPRMTPADAPAYAEGMRAALGGQVVSVTGISPKTHMAQVLVEADYRMKLIGIGLEQAPVRIRTFIGEASPNEVGRNAMQRWYFVPNYEAVRLSEDNLAMQLVGAGVKLVSEDEHITAQGGRVQTKRINRASQIFTKSFTQKYMELSRLSPVYGQLRNIVDMAIVAAFLQHYDLYETLRWDPKLFADEARVTLETYTVPKQVESAVNVVWKGNTLMTPIGGGVSIDAGQAFQSMNVQSDEVGAVSQVHGEVQLPIDDQLRWWWD